MDMITEIIEITVGIETDAIIEIAKGNRNIYGNSSSKGNENRYDRNNNGNRNRCDNINSKRKQKKNIYMMIKTAKEIETETTIEIAKEI